jgi:hypothetical protein
MARYRARCGPAASTNEPEISSIVRSTPAAARWSPPT